MDIQFNRLDIKDVVVGVSGISRSTDFALYLEGYVMFGMIIYLETEVENRKPVGQSDLYFIVK